MARSERRRAVRAWWSCPVVLPWAGATLTGKTAHLSEAGARVLVDGWGLPPERGVRTELSITLENKVIVDLRAEIVRDKIRAAQWIRAMRCLDVSESDEDRLRKRVFQALGEQPGAGLGRSGPMRANRGDRSPRTEGSLRPEDSATFDLLQLPPLAYCARTASPLRGSMWSCSLLSLATLTALRTNT